MVCASSSETGSRLICAICAIYRARRDGWCQCKACPRYAIGHTVRSGKSENLCRQLVLEGLLPARKGLQELLDLPHSCRGTSPLDRNTSQVMAGSAICRSNHVQCNLNGRVASTNTNAAILPPSRDHDVQCMIQQST